MRIDVRLKLGISSGWWEEAHRLVPAYVQCIIDAGATPVVFPVLLVFALYLWLEGTGYQIDYWNFLILAAALIVWFASKYRHPEYAQYFEQNAQRCLTAFLMIYVGKSVFRGGVDETYYSLLIKLSRFGIAFTAFERNLSSR